MTTHPPPYDPRWRYRPLAGLAETDEVMRQLSNLLDLPLDCRRIACRRTQRCQAREVPPCFLEHREFIADCVKSGLRGPRRFWQRQRALARAAERESGR